MNETCLTLDIWTETMTEHILEHIEMINCNIAIKELNEKHTTNYISNVH